MSRSTIAQRKSSPCCIGCIVLLVIAIGFSLAVGIYMYRFAKNNITLVNVAAKTDPPLNTLPAQLLPEKVGDFDRTALHDTLEALPEWHDKGTTGAHVAVYEDTTGHQMTVIAVPTAQAQSARQTGLGVLTAGRGKANSPETGVTIKDTFSGPGERTITTWAKPNWTFMVQTSSTLTSQFVENFHPGGIDTATTGTTEAIAAPAENGALASDPAAAETTTPQAEEPAPAPTPEAAAAPADILTTETAPADDATTAAAQ